MSRIVSVCLCAIVALMSLTGGLFVSPAPVLAASGTLSIETPLHESPEHGAALIALLGEGTVVSIDGPPVDGFYPVTAGNVSGWIRGETLLLEKDAAQERTEGEPPLEGTAETAPLGQTAADNPAPVETTAEVDLGTDPVMSNGMDPAADAMLITQPAAESPTPETEWTEPADDASYGDQTSKTSDSATGTSAVTDGSAPVDGQAPVDKSVPVDKATPVDATGVTPSPELGSAGSATPVPVPSDGAAQPPESVASASEVVVEPTADPNVTPIPVADAAPVGPASVIVDAPIRVGPGPNFDLIFTVPRGSTLQQTGHVIDGYVTAQYKEVTGWVALEHLGAPSAFVEEPSPGETATPTATPPAETPPTEVPPTKVPPTEAAPAESTPVTVKTPRPGSGVAYTIVDMSLRDGPSATEEPVTIVPAGSRVVLTGVMEGGFQRVTYKDQIGWIADEYLQTPPNPEPEIGKDGKQEYSRKQIIRIIHDAADRYGQSREDMLRVAECESNLDPYAVNPSGSYGLFQFIRSTWKSTPYGNDDIFDPEANANAAAWMWSEGRKSEWVCQ